MNNRYLYKAKRKDNGERMKFSKEKFQRNAPKCIREQLKDSLDALDGAEVIFDGRYGRDGYIPQHFGDGEKYYLYPIYKSWCREE